MKTRAFTIVCLAVFFVGGGLFATSVIKAKQDKTKPARPFVITYLASRSVDGEALKPYELQIRAVKSTGEWKETRYSFDGQKTTWGATADAQYVVSGDSRQFLKDNRAENEALFRSSSALKTHQQFIRSEVVAGLTTYVLRAENGGMVGEMSYSPECGHTPLRIHLQNKNTEGGETGKFEVVVEALSVEFRDVSEEEVGIPDLPTRFDKAEQKVETLKAAGLTQQAESLNRIIHQAKSEMKQK
jgi:hypothetical protein